jgi:transposase InsO family protein
VADARQQYPTWGAPKLRWLLEQNHPERPCPAERTIGRWLAEAALTKPRARRAPAGPAVRRHLRGLARQPNDVWTVDFKGWFMTAEGKRVSPLTVRDLATRHLLLVRHLRADQHEVARAMRKLFRHYGLPREIRSDNGPPFGSLGPRGWTPLTLGWVRLGIRVSFGRPGCPQDNAGHEQMHAVLKKEATRPAARTLAQQQRRLEAWRRLYNEQRPHEAIGMVPPATLYRPSPRHLPKHPPAWGYPAGCELRRLDAKGRLIWAGRPRAIGRTFAGQTIGLKPHRRDIAKVYLGRHLLGTLHVSDLTDLRPVRSSSLPGKAGGLRPPAPPPNSSS